MMSTSSSSCSCQDDLFDLLPDAILLEIFNRVHDANSLVNCISTCNRFATLVPQINFLHLTLPSPTTKNLKTADLTKPKLSASSTNHGIKGFINKIILKPIQSFLHTFVPKKSSNCSHCENDVPLIHLPNEILKNFEEIKSLRVELPKNRGDISSNSGDALLKWKAEFGNELQSCVIIGANSFDKVEHRMFENPKQETEQETSSFTNDKLKLRVVWTISCLIAASARHHLLKQILSEHSTIQEAEMVDGSKQGKISMQKGQIQELRNAMKCTEEDELPEIERTKVPALRMKMWYVPELELPASGCVLKGATLVVIRPAPATEKVTGEMRERSEGELATTSFDGEENWIGEAARKMIKKKKAFTLEMNSF